MSKGLCQTQAGSVRMVERPPASPTPMLHPHPCCTRSTGTGPASWLTSTGVINHPASTYKKPKAVLSTPPQLGLEEHLDKETSTTKTTLAITLPRAGLAAPTHRSQPAAVSLPATAPRQDGTKGNPPQGKYLALSDPGRPGRPKLRVSSRWEQPSFWQTSQRCSVLSSSKESSQPWGEGRTTAEWVGGWGGHHHTFLLGGHPPT